MKPNLCVSSESAYTEQELRNRDVIMAFYENGVNRRDFGAALAHLDARYVEHSPNIADGPQGFVDFYTKFCKAHPNFRIEVKRLFIEGDMVAAHVLAHQGPAPNGEAVVDIFRLEGGKIAEHWEVTRPIPDSAANPNSMF